ncbi:MAG: hypothetical protein AAF810_14685 [Cyanobacteria bacterium P01_D01_bin.36]
MRTTMTAPGLAPSVATMQNRFRGAVLGLILAPTPLLIGAIASNSETLEKMSDAIQQVIAQLSDYLSAQNSSANTPFSLLTRGSTQNATGKTNWINALPTLLRYHDQPTQGRHSLWNVEVNEHAPIWLLGDVLSAALSGQPINRQALYREPSPGIPHHHAVATGISIVLGPNHHHANHNHANYNHVSYVHSISTSLRSAVPDSAWETSLIAGLVSGAIVGHRALPILWQQEKCSSVCASRGIALADALFRRWAGFIDEPVSIPPSK